MGINLARVHRADKRFEAEVQLPIDPAGSRTRLRAWENATQL
jgi:hypothetical protein